MRAYVDADILIWNLRGSSEATQFLKSLHRDETLELWTGAIQRAEVSFFAREGELEMTRLFLAQFKTAEVNEEIVDRAAVVFRQWNPSHGIDQNDALLASTAMLTGGVIYTLNVKHYPMPEVIVRKAW